MGISAWQILIILLIVILLFGTKKLRSLGTDLGEAVKGFKKGIENASDSGAGNTDTAARAMEHKAASEAREFNEHKSTAS